MTERRLTDEQREIIADSMPGGLVGYIQRLSEGHWPTFGMGKHGRYLGSCLCGEVLCHRWAIAAYRRDLLDAYQAKVDDFAAETLRAVPESDELVRLRRDHDRYENALRDIAYDDGGVCTYGGHDDARNMMDPECPGAVCWAKRALTPPVTEPALSPDEAAGDE